MRTGTAPSRRPTRAAALAPLAIGCVCAIACAIASLSGCAQPHTGAQATDARDASELIALPPADELRQTGVFSTASFNEEQFAEIGIEGMFDGLRTNLEEMGLTPREVERGTDTRTFAIDLTPVLTAAPETSGDDDQATTAYIRFIVRDNGFYQSTTHIRKDSTLRDDPQGLHFLTTVPFTILWHGK